MAKTDLTAQRLRELLDYNPDTGVFRWRNPRGKAVNKPSAGSSDSSGYTKIGIAGRDYRAHRLVWLYVHGVWPDGQVDHMDGNPGNNAIGNLRDVPQTVNQHNQRTAHTNNGHGFMGASRNGKKWKARILVDGVRRYLGVFDTPEAAHTAYLSAKRDQHSGYLA